MDNWYTQIVREHERRCGKFLVQAGKNSKGYHIKCSECGKVLMHWKCNKIKDET